MKTFLNVLYRRILYKIPLKLLLVLLAIFGVLFACFSNAQSYNGRYEATMQMGANATWDFGKNNGNVMSLGDNLLFCMMNNMNNSCNFTATYNGISVSLDPSDPNKVACIAGVSVSETVGVHVVNNSNSYCYGMYFFIPQDEINQKMTSLQCQTEYNLIPVSSVDQNYCTTNNLCPSCPVCPDIPVFSGDLSELYINNILHVGAPTIIMNIPEEIDWDYAYTQGGNIMNIDVVGYNVDYEKIDSIVQFQNYKPTSEDFQKIIGLLAPYTKIIVFFVFLFIVWAWIKKPFKSKKL